MIHRPALRVINLLAILCAVMVSCAQEEADPWNEVTQILSETQGNIVLDGVEKASITYTGTAQPDYGDWMVQHMLSDPENYNPVTSNDQGSTLVHAYVFESLLYQEPEPPYEQKGMVATAYPDISEDKLTYTFELRENVKFADGEPLTADDVMFSMKVIQNSAVRAPHLRNYYSSVADVRQDGKYKISFVCKDPYILNDLFLGGFAILPKHFYDPDGLLDRVPVKSLIDDSWQKGRNKDRIQRFGEQFNQNFNRNMLGSGPYQILDWENDVVTGQKIVLSRNDTYWGRGVGDLPPTGFVDKIVFKIIQNQDAAFIELTNGNLDVHSMKPLEFKEKSWSPEFNERFLKGIKYAGGYTYIGWNNTHPIFKDKQVRKAMTHFTDRGSMVENLLFGLGEPVEGPIHKFRPEYNHDLKSYTFDPDLGLEILTNAGWKDTDEDGILDKEIDGKKTPFAFEFLVNSGNQLRKDIALTLQNELSDIGIKCDVLELDWSIFLERVRGKDFAAVTLGWTGGTGLRSPPDAYQIWHSSQAESQGSNFISFKNDEVDKILEDYRKEFDMDKRIEMYRRFQEILYDEQPYTFLWKQRGATAYSRRFQGVTWHPDGVDTQEWWVNSANRLYQ